MWSGSDFKVNKMYWNRWGAEAALPFRIANLNCIFASAEAINLSPIVVGRSARHLFEFGGLREDHDDDIAFAMPIEEIERKLSPQLLTAGFTTIRRNESMWSVARFDRYVDFHSGFDGDAADVHAHGSLWKAQYFAPVPELKSGRPNIIHRVSSAARQIIRSPRSAAIGFLEKIPPRLDTSQELIGEISLDDFLSLRFDTEGAINWEWRGSHLSKIAWPGAKIGEILERIDLVKLREGLVETPLGTVLPEPINLSRDFWQTGNNYFVVPLLSGFRHGVLPYNAANLYIRNIIQPNLYSLEYYESLPKVTETELPSFLYQRPIAVRKQSVRSGRHRVATMIGRLAQGLPYVPFWGISEK